jgi:hypothetical protein
MAMRRALVCLLAAAGCGGDEGISTEIEVAQLVAEVTVVAYEGLLAGIGGEEVNGVITVPCSESGTLAATVDADGEGRRMATFTSCSRGGNAFSGSLNASFGVTGTGAFMLGYSGALTAAGTVTATLSFPDMMESVTFTAARNFTMRLTGTVTVEDAGGVHGFTFADDAFAYDDATGMVTAAQ